MKKLCSFLFLLVAFTANAQDLCRRKPIYKNNEAIKAYSSAGAATNIVKLDSSNNLILTAGQGMSFYATTGDYANYYWYSRGQLLAKLVDTDPDDDGIQGIDLILGSNTPGMGIMRIGSTGQGGADTADLLICGGGPDAAGFCTAEHGPYIWMQPNDEGTPGSSGMMHISSGGGTEGIIYFSTMSAADTAIVRWVMTDDDIRFGTAGVANQTPTFYAATADGSDSGTFGISSGGLESGAINSIRGAYAKFEGDDVGGANSGGEAYIGAGDNSTDLVHLQQNNIDIVSFGQSTATIRKVLLGDASTANQAFHIRPQTADGADTASILMAAGGAPSSYTRGPYLEMWGNDEATYGGNFYISAGDNTRGNGDIWFRSNNANRFGVTYAGNFEQQAANGGLIKANATNGKFILPKSGTDLPDSPVEGSWWIDTNDSDCSDSNADANDAAFCVYIDGAWMLLAAKDL